MSSQGVGPLDPYGEGMDAHSRGVARDACPFAERPERERWLAGWDRQALNEGDTSRAED